MSQPRLHTPGKLGSSAVRCGVCIRPAVSHARCGVWPSQRCLGVRGRAAPPGWLVTGQLPGSGGSAGCAPPIPRGRASASGPCRLEVHGGPVFIQVSSRTRHIVSHLIAGRAGVTGDPLETHVDSPIGELAQLLSDPVRQGVALRRRAVPQPSECQLETVQISTSLGAESAAASC